jgi:prephenate dehydrogenase
MAGTEKSGFDASEPDLFKGAPWIVVPHKKNKADLDAWIRLFGAKPILMNAADHDRKTALISHLPALISKALLDFVQKMDPECLQIAGPGFRSMTRLAKGNPELMKEISSFNKKNLETFWKEWIQFINPAGK